MECPHAPIHFMEHDGQIQAGHARGQECILHVLITHDFLYRINRRRTSSCDVEGLEINRTSTWSAVQIIETFVDVSGDGERPPKVTRRPNPGGISRLEFDINTIPEFDRTLDKDVVSEIFNELVDAGNEIAVKGDVS